MIGAGDETEQIRVFLVEDHDLVRRSVAHLIELEPDITVVGEAAGVAAAPDAVAAAAPHIVLIDVRLQDGNGIELCREIRGRCPDVRCIMLTSFSDDRAVVDSAVAGASGFVLKQIRSNHIVDSIRAVAAGEVLLEEDTVQACLVRLAQTEAEGVAKLTSAQRQLFQLIGQGRSNLPIADVLGVDLDRVRSDISVLLRRLGMVRRTEVADAYRRTGASQDVVLYHLRIGPTKLIENGGVR